jgi:hypothetical protein
LLTLLAHRRFARARARPTRELESRCRAPRSVRPSSWSPPRCLIVGALPATAFGAVSVSRAEVSGGDLRIEGRAIANRSITVDGTAMTTSDRSGNFRVSRGSFTPPADCTVDVNDGSVSPAVARLSDCTVASPPPSTSV